MLNYKISLQYKKVIPSLISPLLSMQRMKMFYLHKGFQVLRHPTLTHMWCLIVLISSWDANVEQFDVKHNWKFNIFMAQFWGFMVDEDFMDWCVVMEEFVKLSKRLCAWKTFSLTRKIDDEVNERWRNVFLVSLCDNYKWRDAIESIDFLISLQVAQSPKEQKQVSRWMSVFSARMEHDDNFSCFVPRTDTLT